MLPKGSDNETTRNRNSAPAGADPVRRSGSGAGGGVALLDGGQEGSALVVGDGAGGVGGLHTGHQFGDRGSANEEVASGRLGQLDGEEGEAHVRRGQLAFGEHEHASGGGLASLALVLELTSEDVVVEGFQGDHGAGSVAAANLGHDRCIEQRLVEEWVVVVEQELYHGPMVIIDGPRRHVDADHAVRAGAGGLVSGQHLGWSTGERQRNQLGHGASVPAGQHERVRN